jgi:hypothetical protein
VPPPALFGDFGGQVDSARGDVIAFKAGKFLSPDNPRVYGATAA